MGHLLNISDPSQVISGSINQSTVYLLHSVADPWHFGVDPDPDLDPRIQCLGLMDPDPDPIIFVIDPQDETKNKFCKNNFFCLLLFEVTCTSFFKDKKVKKSHIIEGVKVFLTIFAWWEKDPDLEPNPDPYLWLMDSDTDTGGPKTCGSGGSRSGFGSRSATLVPHYYLHLVINCYKNTPPVNKGTRLRVLLPENLRTCFEPSV